MTHAVEPADWRWGPELDAVAAAPGSHRVILENEHVRVLEVTVAPGVREPEHTHRLPSVMVTHQRARIVYRVGEEIRFTSPVQPPAPTDGLVGEWLGPEGPHSVENIDTVELRAVRTEFKNLA